MINRLVVSCGEKHEMKYNKDIKIALPIALILWGFPIIFALLV
jgi:hypothetical protein